MLECSEPYPYAVEADAAAARWAAVWVDAERLLDERQDRKRALEAAKHAFPEEILLAGWRAGQELRGGP